MTNELYQPHGVWSLTKHVAGSISHAAGKLDAAVYGNTPIPPHQPSFAELHPILSSVGAGIGALVLLAFFILLASMDKKDRPSGWSWWI
jgi:hypothetical protein